MDSGNFPKLDDVVKTHVLAALDLAGGNKAKAAGLLGVSIKTVYNHVNRYSTEVPAPVIANSVSSEGASVEAAGLPTGNGGSTTIFG
jgi:transposase